MSIPMPPPRNWFTLNPSNPMLRKLNKKQYKDAMRWCRIVSKLTKENIAELNKHSIDALIYGGSSVLYRRDAKGSIAIKHLEDFKQYKFKKEK